MGEVPLLQCGVHPEEVSRPKGSGRPGLASVAARRLRARRGRQVGGFVSLPFGLRSLDERPRRPLLANGGFQELVGVGWEGGRGWAGLRTQTWLGVRFWGMASRTPDLPASPRAHRLAFYARAPEPT
jgi:hypothetical protein